MVASLLKWSTELSTGQKVSKISLCLHVATHENLNSALPPLLLCQLSRLKIKFRRELTMELSADKNGKKYSEVVKILGQEERPLSF